MGTAAGGQEGSDDRVTDPEREPLMEREGYLEHDERAEPRHQDPLLFPIGWIREEHEHQDEWFSPKHECEEGTEQVRWAHGP